MKPTDTIEKLFEDENLPDSPDRRELPLIRPLEAIDADLKGGTLGEKPPSAAEQDDRRTFSRADVTEKRLELKFSTSTQFARQYIENISMGGLFVKTDEKHPMGAIIPIEFSIPLKQGQSPTLFQLKAKVCRVTPGGLGLEFVNITPTLRSELEEFVRIALPQGVPVLNKAKLSAIETLERLRNSRREAAERRKKFAINTVAIGFLLFLNGFLYVKHDEASRDEASFHTQKLKMGGREVSTDQIRSIERRTDKGWVVKIADQSEILTSESELEHQLPYHLRQSLQLLKSTQPLVRPRDSKNAKGLVRRR